MEVVGEVMVGVALVEAMVAGEEGTGAMVDMHPMLEEGEEEEEVMVIMVEDMDTADTHQGTAVTQDMQGTEAVVEAMEERMAITWAPIVVGTEMPRKAKLKCQETRVVRMDIMRITAAMEEEVVEEVVEEAVGDMVEDIVREAVVKCPSRVQSVTVHIDSSRVKNE